MKYLMLGLVTVMLLSGCSQNSMTGQTVKKDGDTMVIEDKDDDVVVRATQGSGDWCDEGADWSWISGQEQAQAKWEVKGIVGSGDYKGFCHIEYIMENPQGTTRMNYYISEDQESGYLEMQLPDGQTFKQEWAK